MRIPRGDHSRIVLEYTIDFVPIIAIASRYGVTRQAVYKVLWANGVDTNKRKFPTICAHCGAPIMRHRNRIRSSMRLFCGQYCYTAWVNAQHGEYRPWRHGSRIARAAVDSVFPLQPGHVVHHIDGDERNNDLRNLMVFASNADHVSYHRGGDGSPVWDGSRPGGAA